MKHRIITLLSILLLATTWALAQAPTMTFDGTKLHFVLSTDDELLGDHHYLEQRFPDCHDFNYFDQQGHRFAGVKILKPIIERGMNG